MTTTTAIIGYMALTMIGATLAAPLVGRWLRASRRAAMRFTWQSWKGEG